MNINQLVTHFLLEMIGTCLLYLAIIVPLSYLFLAGSTGGTLEYTILISGYMAVAAVASCYRVTGGQLNPIVSLVNAFRKDKPEGFSVAINLLYILAQFVGCAIGGALAWWFTTETSEVKPNTGGYEDDDILISESTGYTFFLSFIMTLVYLTVTGKDTTPTKDTGMQSVIIGLTYGFLPVWLTLSAGGGYMNPWIDLFASLYRVIDYENDEDDWEYMYINLIVPWFGAILAFAVHQFILLPGARKAGRDIEYNGKVVEATIMIN